MCPIQINARASEAGDCTSSWANARASELGALTVSAPRGGTPALSPTRVRSEPNIFGWRLLLQEPLDPRVDLARAGRRSKGEQGARARA
jgi:hypothetical protein